VGPAESLQLGIGRVLAATPASLTRALAGKPVRIDGQTLHPEAKTVARNSKLLGLDADNVTIEQERARGERGGRLTRGKPFAVGEVRELKVDGGDGSLDARLYVPKSPPETGPLIVYFHGGGYAIGSLDTHDQACRFFCREIPTRVLHVAYRLAPEHPFPAAIDDGLAAFRWAHENAQELGADPARISVGGDSAGGGIATAVARLSRGTEGPTPARQILIYPVTDVSRKRPSYDLFGEGFFLTERMLDRWYGYATKVEDRVDPRISPLLDDDLSGLPPTNILVAGFDPLRDEGLEYAEALRAAGNEVSLTFADDLIHGFLNAAAISPRCAEAFCDFAVTLRS
jgi:acetyl esterase